jgi:hypothetical protein
VRSGTKSRCDVQCVMRGRAIAAAAHRRGPTGWSCRSKASSSSSSVRRCRRQSRTGLTICPHGNAAGDDSALCLRRARVQWQGIRIDHRARRSAVWQRFRGPGSAGDRPPISSQVECCCCHALWVSGVLLSLQHSRLVAVCMKAFYAALRCVCGMCA